MRVMTMITAHHIGASAADETAAFFGCAGAWSWSMERHDSDVGSLYSGRFKLAAMHLMGGKAVIAMFQPLFPSQCLR